MRFQDGSKWVYGIPPGTNSLQPFLLEVVDRWGQKLTVGYNAQVQISTITDAVGQITSFRYDSAGRVTRVWDPFGRHASFGYDANGNLTEVIDVEGQSFQYTYDSLVRITQLNTAQGPWNFKHEGPDGNSSTSDTYPYPDGPMWASIRTTVTDPMGDKEEYFYYAGWGYPTDGIADERSWHVSKNHYVEYRDGSHNNAASWVPKTQWDTGSGASNPGQTIGGVGKVRIKSNPAGEKTYFDYNTSNGLPSRVTDARGNSTLIAYNNQGKIVSTTDPKGNVSTKTYAPNGIDVISTTNANGVQATSATYNAQHQPLTTADVNGTTFYTYNARGLRVMKVDPQNHATRNIYNAMSQRVSVQQSEAPATTGGTRNWNTLNSFTYDEVGRVQTETDSTGLTTGYRYNNLNAVTQVIYPDGTSETTDYTCCKLPGIVKDRSGRKTYYDYDPSRHLVRVQDPQGNTLQRDLDKNGNLIRLVDAKGNLTKWRYDAADRIVEKMYHDGTSESYVYDGGLLSQTKGARGQIASYSYDVSSNLTGTNYPNMADVTMSYNALNRMTQVVDGVGTHTFTYDNLGKMLAQDGPFANDAQSFTYDTLQRVQSHSVERGASGGTQSQSHSYDSLGRLVALSSTGTQGVGNFSYNYVGLTNLLSSLNRPNGTETVQNYDGLQRLTAVNNLSPSDTVQDRYGYAYDTRDVRTGVQMQQGSDPLREISYSYDIGNQLVGEAATGGVAGTTYSNAYSYDAMGNRLKRENTQGTNTLLTSSGVNALNQLTSVSTVVDGGPRTTSGLSYDAAGNLTETSSADGSRTLYFYDDEDRLFRVEKRDAADAPVSKSEFVYDYASRKAVSQEFTYTNGAWAQTSEKRRVFDGMDVVQERNESNQVTAQIVRAGNIGGILARSTALGASFFGYDGSGNVTLLTDTSGNEVGRYRYDAFGNTLETSGVRAMENPYRFSTKELHGASGLYDYGYRFYSTSLGRWLNRDPIQENGGSNLYHFLANSPPNNQDEYGECIPCLLYVFGAVVLAGLAGCSPQASAPAPPPNDDPCNPLYAAIPACGEVCTALSQGNQVQGYVVYECCSAMSPDAPGVGSLPRVGNTGTGNVPVVALRCQTDLCGRIACEGM